LYAQAEPAGEVNDQHDRLVCAQCCALAAIAAAAMHTTGWCIVRQNFVPNSAQP
jgi:hypothetical protein